MQPKQLSTFSIIARLLTFRLTREEFAEFNGKTLAVGLTCTWLAGIGRTLHNHRVEWWQHLGLGSVAYIFVLSLLLYLVLAPLRTKSLSYRHVLTFVSLTSPTGFMYAIPVERFLYIDTATMMRGWFLAVVAAWRVALLFFYLHRYFGFSRLRTVVVSLLPLSGIVTALTALNLDKVVFDIMGGGPRSSDDEAYSFLLLLTFISILAFLPLLLAYMVAVVEAGKPHEDVWPEDSLITLQDLTPLQVPRIENKEAGNSPNDKGE